VAAIAVATVAVAEGGGGRGLEIALSRTTLAQDGAVLYLADPELVFTNTLCGIETSIFCPKY
jgi:hypothetical protein